MKPNLGKYHYKRKKILLYFFLLIPFISFAQVNQQWAQTYSGSAKGMDEAHAMTTDATGNIAITGASISANGDLDIITLLYSSEGKQLWKQTFNGTANEDDNGKSIAMDAVGNVYVAGYASQKGQGEDMVVIKYDKSGNMLWSLNLNGTADSSDQVAAMALDNAGNIVVTGYTSNKSTGTDIATMKIDPNGNKLWSKEYNGTDNGNDAARALAIDSAGNIYVTGYAVNTDSNYDITTIKYSPKGEQLWVATYNGKGDDYDEANAIALDAEGNVYVAGFTDISEKRNDLILIKYNPSGEALFTKTYSGKGNDDEARAITISGKNVILTGHSANKSVDYDILTICYSTSGTQQWVQTYNGTLSSDDEGIAITADQNGNAYITGYTNNIQDSEDIITLKYNSTGIQQWAKTFNGTENFDDYPYAICRDQDGNILVTGATNYDIINNTNDGDIILLKYSQTK